MGNAVALRHPASESKPSLGTLRIECPYPVLAFALKEMLKEEAYVYEGHNKPLTMERPSSVILCPNGKDDVASEVRRLRDQAPGAAILVFDMCVDRQVVLRALRAGASGFIHAGMHPEQIVRAIRLAREGRLIVSQTMVSKELLENMVTENGAAPAILTPRQREILELASEGLSNAQIGERLFLTESTVKQHLHKAYRLLKVRNRTEAIKALRDAELRG